MNKITVIILASLLTGCASQTANVAPEDKNITHILDDFRIETQLGFSPFNVYDPTGLNPGLHKANGFDAYQKWYCARGDDIEKKAEELITKYCDEAGGVYDGEWCHDLLLAGEPIFKAQVGKGSLIDRSIRQSDCSAGNLTAFIAVTKEGTNERQKWVSWSKSNLNYLAPYEKREKEKEQALALEKIRQERNERKIQERNYILASGAGTKVCRVERNIVFVGFVERVENGKIKISIVNAHLQGSPNISPQGFKQTITWDQPENWSRCS